MLNVHPSLLPRWRGAAPIERTIMAGDERTGICVMQVTAGLDSGPVALCEETPVGAEEDFEALSAKLATLGGDLLVGALDLLAEGGLEFAEQDEEGATYAEKVDAGERRLDPRARRQSSPGSSAPSLRMSAPISRPAMASGSEFAAPGRSTSRSRPVVRAEWGALLLGCGQGALRLEVVQPAGGRPMAADAFLRGHPLPKLWTLS